MRGRKAVCCLVSAGCLLMAGIGTADTCPDAPPGEKQLLWGDLHVHTAHSLDAWAFGAIATPREAYAYARGEPLRLLTGEVKTIDRPLDFMAVTDHAETWDQMYLCTDPGYADQPYCNNLRALHRERASREIFNDYLLPVVGSLDPQPAGVCEDEAFDCPQARKKAWQRVQNAANSANDPCNFTALIGYEWTGSPGGRHWHRNVIFRSAEVPEQAYDFVRFPEVQQLWHQLDTNCRASDGCNVLTIPHNINWADGGRTFAVETETAEAWAVRARFERLAEIFQEKGASECLPERPSELGEDCNFNLLMHNSAKERLSGPDKSSPAEAWARARSTYYRSLLARGLAAYQAGASRVNPLMLGAIGSTDTHFGTPGRVMEVDYDRGISTLLLTDEEQLGNTSYNPGGLVAVWAEQNTRAGVFDALHRREAYATSGPRISLRFGVADGGYCDVERAAMAVVMGGSIPASPALASDPPWFAIQAGMDQAKLARVEVIKGEYRNGQVHERVVQLADYPDGQADVCLTWQDADFQPQAPTYWYVRVLEVPTPRWSKFLCERAKLCEKYPQADLMQTERAWSSPIWWLP